MILQKEIALVCAALAAGGWIGLLIGIDEFGAAAASTAFAVFGFTVLKRAGTRRPRRSTQSILLEDASRHL